MSDHFHKTVLLRIFLAIFLAALPGSLLLAQHSTAKSDSLRRKFEQDSTHLFRYQKFKPYLNIDFRNAYVVKSFLSLVGIRAGTTMDGNHIFGLGYYVLNEFPIFKSNKIKVYQFEKLNYVTLFYEYKIYNGRVFDVLLPFELGYGTYSASLSESPETKVSSSMIPTGFGIKCILMPHQWIGIKFGGGYRYVWENTANVGMDGGYFTVGIRIDLDHMFRDIRFSRLKHQYHKNLKSL
jgi:hypothetical protein